VQHPARKIRVSIARQQLELWDAGSLLRTYDVSTSQFGEGSEPGSYKTPLGRFRIAEKIGDGVKVGEIFKSRVATGRIGTEEDADDFVQTRILWLDGLDAENKNTRERYVYIHGTNHESSIGTKASHGCVRMHNEEVIELYDRVEQGTEVFIQP
jgi:lipoprotein-anchoring transpeptidase ErfK/SrfK